MTVVSIISAMTSSGNEKGPALWPGQSGVSGGSGGGLPSRLQPVPRVVEEGSGRHGLDRIGGDQRRHPAKAIGPHLGAGPSRYDFDIVEALAAFPDVLENALIANQIGRAAWWERGGNSV